MTTARTILITLTLATRAVAATACALWVLGATGAIVTEVACTEFNVTEES